MFLATLASAQESLPGAQPLMMSCDLSAQMVAGIGRFLDAETRASIPGRAAFWRIDSSSAEAHEKSVAANRARFARMIGVADARVATSRKAEFDSLRPDRIFAAVRVLPNASLMCNFDLTRTLVAGRTPGGSQIGAPIS